MAEKQQPSTREKITVLVLLAISLLYFGWGWSLKLGSWSNPGAGFLPRVVGIALLCLAAVKFWAVFFSSREGGKPPGGAPGRNRNPRAVYGLLLAIILYPILLGYLNFLLTTTLVLFLLFVLLKYKTPVFSLMVAGVLAVVSFIVFARLLGVSLPSGPLEEIFYALGR